jgi:hypothetical protein
MMNVLSEKIKMNFLRESFSTEGAGLRFMGAETMGDGDDISNTTSLIYIRVLEFCHPLSQNRYPSFVTR